MNEIAVRMTWVAVVVLVTVAANAERLRRDPFSPPAEFAAPTARPNALTGALGATPEIRGILVADGESLVNLGGEIIGPGEEASGYLLLEVGEEYAVFQRGDEVVTLSLYPETEDEGD